MEITKGEGDEFQKEIQEGSGKEGVRPSRIRDGGHLVR